MASIMEIMQFCRLCLVKEQVNVPIFEEHGDIRQIFLKITACLPVKVNRDDDLPKKICDGCLYKLDLLYQFWNTAANAEKQLLSWLSAAGLESKAKIHEEIVVSPTQVILKEEPNTDIPSDLPNDLPNDQNFMQPQLPFESVDFAYGDTGYQDAPETVTTSELIGNDGEPSAKRPRRAAAAACAAATAAELANSESEEDVDDPVDQTITKTEDETEEEEENDLDMTEVEPAFVDVSQEANPEAQPGPSGIGKPGEAQNVHACAVCGKHYGSASQLRNHKRYHKEKEHACPNCGKLFVTRATLRAHIEYCGIVDPAYQCESCGKKIKRKKTYDRHVKTHLNEYMCYCDICGRGYSTYNAARVHKESVHLGIKHSCQHCGKMFSMRDELRIHLKLHDPLYKPPEFKCEQCGYVTQFKRYFNRHMRVHAGIYKFMCEICGKELTSRESLKAHKRVHNKERPFGCSVCGKKFGAKATLKIHKRTHTGQLYSCKVCEKTFTQRSTLSVHMRSHTGYLPYKCGLCEGCFASKAFLKKHSKEAHNLCI